MGVEIGVSDSACSIPSAILEGARLCQWHYSVTVVSEQALTLADPIATRIRRLGLTEEQASMYDALLAHGPMPPTELAQTAGLTLQEALGELEEMADIGLVGNLHSATSLVKPLQPDPALELLARRRAVEVNEASSAVQRAFAHYRRTVGADGSHGLVELIRGDEVLERAHMIERGARASVRALDCPPYHSEIGPNSIELENLARGLSYRLVYAGEAIENTEYLDRNIRPAIASGERARVLLNVPVKLLLVDGRVALVSSTTAETDVCTSALLVRAASLLTALDALWQSCWQAAVSLDASGTPSDSPLEPVEARFLKLLSTGASDEQVARVLGISRRTFFRYLEQMMARTGATTRFQLAAHATRRGWI